MIDKIIEQKIKDSADIVDVVSEFVKLEKKGSTYVGLCPFHDDHTPSFYVSPSRKTYKCFVCGEGGDAVSFIMKKLTLSYPEALEWLAKRYNIKISTEHLPKEEWMLQKDKEAMFATNAAVLEFYSKSLESSEEAKVYFQDRGVKWRTLERFHLGFAPNSTDVMSTLKDTEYGMKYLFPENTDVTFKSGKTLHVTNGTGIVYQYEGRFHDRFAGRVIFPWLNSTGKVVAFGGRKLDAATHGVDQKYVNSPDCVIYHKDHELYGIYQAKTAIMQMNRVYIVEGYLDAILMNQTGMANVVANSGTALSVHQISLLKKYTKNITLIYDSDEPGIRAALRSLSMLLENDCNVNVLLLPEDEDPASFIQNHSEDYIHRYFTNHTQNFVQFMCDVFMSKEQSIDDKSDAIERILTNISKIKDDIKQELYFKELALTIDMEESILRRAFNKICGREGKDVSYYERIKEAAGIRRILHFAKESIAQETGGKYTPEENWMSDTCLHSFDEYMEELRSIQKQLCSFVNGGTRKIVGRGLNAYCETYEEYMSHGEHETAQSGNVVFRYPFTRKQYEANEEAAHKTACKRFSQLINDINSQLKAKDGQTNAEVVEEYKREEQEVQARLSNLVNSERFTPSTIDEDNMPF